MKMLSYLIDVYYHQLRDLTGVNYGWILRRFMVFFLVGLLIGIVATHAFSDIRTDYKTGSIEIWFDQTGDRKKVYLYADAEVTRWVEGNEHFSELTWADGYCLKFSHYHKSGIPKSNVSSVVASPEPASTPVATSVESTPDPAAVEEHIESTPDAVSEPREPVIAPTAQSANEVVEVRRPLLPIIITEYMMRDGGGRELPVWIELHNPNAAVVALKGYTFTWATRKFANLPWEYHIHIIEDFSIPANSAVILASKRLTRISQYGGISEDQVYDLGIRHGRLLKSGWKLSDPRGIEIFSIGRAFDAGRVVLNGTWQMRESHERYASEQPSMPYFYGDANDKGSPGFYQERIPKAPRAIRRKHIGTWANLKRAGKVLGIEQGQVGYLGVWTQHSRHGR